MCSSNEFRIDLILTGTALNVMQCINPSTRLIQSCRKKMKRVYSFYLKGSRFHFKGQMFSYFRETNLWDTQTVLIQAKIILLVSWNLKCVLVTIVGDNKKSKGNNSKRIFLTKRDIHGALSCTKHEITQR